MPTWLVIVLALGGTAIISSAVGLVFHFIRKKIETEQERKEQEELDIKKIEEQVYEERLRSIIREENAPQNEAIREVKEIVASIKEGTIAGLRADMRLFLDVMELRGTAKPSDKAAWRDLYNQYDKLGGNFFKEYVNEWKQEVEDFHSKKGE